MTSTFHWLTALTMMLGVLSQVSRTHAQTIVPPLEELPGVLTVGQLVSVTDHRGRSTKGRLVAVSPTDLTVLERDSLGTSSRTTIRSSDVARVRRWDRLWNGLLIGAGVGAGMTAVLVHSHCGPRNRECSANFGSVVAFTLVPALSGAGALVDRWLGNDVIYSASPPSRSVTTLLRPGGLGVAVDLRF
jgi:hypothetical protein